MCDKSPNFMDHLAKKCPRNMLLAECAKFYRGTPGPIKELYDSKAFKGKFKGILAKKNIKDAPLQLAINGRDDRHAGFY